MKRDEFDALVKEISHGADEITVTGEEDYNTITKEENDE